MPKFIKLTDWADQSPLYVNVAHIVAVGQLRAHGVLRLLDVEEAMEVCETAAEVVGMIKDA